MTQNSAIHTLKRVFISYSHLDKERIAPFLLEIEKQSIPFWYDKDLHAGSVFSNEIAQNIKACDGFLLFLSQNAANSWYVFDELTYARNKRKKVVVIHLEDNIVMPDGMELLLINLHQLFSMEWGVDSCIEQLVLTLSSNEQGYAEPILSGLLNHKSELLERCRETFDHISSQMGVQNVEESIDPNLFCPIRTARKDHNEQVVELYSEICRENHTHILLQADGGLGKTYTFLYTMKRLLDCDRPCAYIPCHLFTQANQERSGLILNTLCQMYLPPQKHNADDLNEYFRSQTYKTFVLFLDGFNEAVVKGQLSNELINLSSMFPNIKVVVSSRYTDPVFANYARYTMYGLNSNRVASILQKSNREYSQLNYSLQKLLLTPMFLRIYLRNDQLDREIDTAAELMDQERKRVLNNIRLGGSDMRYKTIADCLKRLFPNFVRHEYCTSDRGMSFPKRRLEEYFLSQSVSTDLFTYLFGFLVEYSIIMKVNDRTDSYAYQHEHYRDYWVAYSIFQELLQSVTEYTGAERANAIIDALKSDYSHIVLRYVGELAQVNTRNNTLDHVLNSLRRNAVEDDLLWLDARMASVTSKVIDIYKLVLEEDLVGLDLNGLNLSATNLNQTRTCTRNKKATFQGSLIAERTFIASMHESAPRRVEVLRMEGKNYLVTVSNQDLLISALPELETVWRYPHVDMEGQTVSTHTITTSVMLGDCLLAVDTFGDVWEWDFYQKGGIPFASALYRHLEAGPAVKVIPWSDDDGALIALQRKDGTILQFAPRYNPETGWESLGILSEEYQISELADVDTYKTITSSPVHTFICWAVAQQDGIRVMKYDINGMMCYEICFIPDCGFIPDYMICVGSEQASRSNHSLEFGSSAQDGTMLILSALKPADGNNPSKTRLYQINLPQRTVSEAEYVLLKWFDGHSELANQYEKTLRQFDRINATSFSNGMMVLAASDGRVYHYTYDQSQRCFVPDQSAPWVSITKMTFAIEDVLLISEDTIAAVSVDRSVHLIDAKSLFLKKKLRGYNDGLRRLVLINDRLIMATSYDGCILELARDGERFVCRNKLPVSAWCWSLQKISASIYAVGYMSGLALADISNDTILDRISGYEQKVEHLLYLPDVDSQLLVAASKGGVRVYIIQEQNGRMWMEDAGKLDLPEHYSCYWILRNDNALFLALSGINEARPCIARYDLSQPLLGQKPLIIKTQSAKGRIRDIHLLHNYLMVSGLCGDDGDKKSSQVGFIDITDINQATTKLSIKGFQDFIVHSAIYALDERRWRLAMIDSQSNGVLYQYVLTETDQGTLIEKFVSEHTFPAILCDVAFDSKGDLLLTCLNGCLYGKQWEKESVDVLFRNRSYLLTFGTDMSNLYHAVDPRSRLGMVLTDFGNRLVKSKRNFRGSK